MPELPKGSHPDSILLTFRVAREHAGQRLDTFLQQQITRISRTRAKAIVSNCARRQDGTPRRASERVKAGEIVLIVRPPMNEPDTPQSFGVLLEDAGVLVVDKPPGLPMHPTATYHKHTLWYLMRQRYGEDNAPQLAHRLDRETSGVVVCAKDIHNERALKRSFEDRKVKKTYLAIVHGHPPDEFDMTAGMRRVTEGLHILMEVVDVKDGGQASQTQAFVLARIPAADDHEGFSLVKLHPRTGRQHQLRVHLSHAGYPIVADKLYGPEGHAPFLEHIRNGGMSDSLWERLLHDRQALHAYELEMPHPAGKQLQARSPFPEDLCQLWARLGGVASAVETLT